MTGVNMDEFTGDLKDVADILGPDVARELRRVAGGLEIVIPASVPRDGPLAAMPRDMLERLCAAFPRDRIYVSSGARPPRRTRERVVRMKSRGLRNWEIARRLRISERQVRHHLSRARLPAREGLPRRLPLLDFLEKEKGRG